MKIRRFIALIAAVLMVFALAACAKAPKEEELIPITVSEVTHSLFYAPQYAAIALGYFEEEGLQIDLINGGGADKVMTSVITGEVEIGFAGPEQCIYIYNQGREDSASVFAQITQCDGSFLVGREPQEDFDFSHIKGKHVLAGRAGGVPYMTLEYMLRDFGVTPENTELDTSVEFNAMAATFAAGTGDYVSLFEPTASAMQLEGKGYILGSIGAASGEIPYTAYFALNSYIEENPDIITSFTRAIYRGQQWVEKSAPEEIAETISSFFADTDLEILTSAIANYKSIDAWKTDPLLTEESFDRLQNVIESAGELETRVPYEAIINTSFAKSVIEK